MTLRISSNEIHNRRAGRSTGSGRGFGLPAGTRPTPLSSLSLDEQAIGEIAELPMRYGLKSRAGHEAHRPVHRNWSADSAEFRPGVERPR